MSKQFYLHAKELTNHEALNSVSSLWQIYLYIHFPSPNLPLFALWSIIYHLVYTVEQLQEHNGAKVL